MMMGRRIGRPILLLIFAALAGTGAQAAQNWLAHGGTSTWTLEARALENLGMAMTVSGALKQASPTVFTLTIRSQGGLEFDGQGG